MSLDKLREMIVVQIEKRYGLEPGSLKDKNTFEMEEICGVKEGTFVNLFAASIAPLFEMAKQLPSWEEEELEKLINAKYSGRKTIFIVFFSMRGDINIQDKRLKEVTWGYYEIGDGGSSACIYAGDLTHDELVELYKQYNIDQKSKMSDEDDDFEIIEIYNYFEYNGYNFDYDPNDSESELFWIINESKNEIINYLK